MAGTGVAHYRGRKALTQAVVAASLGVDAGRMSRIEKGEIIPTAAEVDALVGILEVPPSYLFSRNILAEVADRARDAAAS